MVERLTRCRPLLGTFVEITSDHEGAIEAAFEAIGRVHKLMSAHDADSDVSRINRFAHGQSVEVDPWTATVIRRALYWSKHSNRAFDVAAAGAAAIESGYLPRHAGQPQPECRSWTGLHVDDCSVRLMAPACIDLGGIAKGFAVDRAVEAMQAAGAGLGLVNAGGDIAGFGRQPWPVQVVEPASRSAIANVAVTNGALATTSAQPDGSHTHLPGLAPGLCSATVCAPDSADADALTKIVICGSPFADRCLHLAGAVAFVVDRDGNVSNIEPHRHAA